MNNIKQLIEQVLSDSEILNLVPDKKAHFLYAIKPSTPYIVYQVIDENGEEWAENKEIATSYYIQIDIFSKTEYSQLEQKIKERMINAGFCRSMSADLYEKDTQLYHKAMRFYITLEIN